jgi:adenosine kinase
VRIAITGSIATDHLMTFPGRFTESLIADKLDKVSLSFLVDGLDIRRGGVGANIAFGMASLGERPVLLGAVGQDFSEYRDWLERHGVDCDSVLVSTTQHTARFVCTTDREHNQIASFYPGAMSEAREIDLVAVADRLGGVDLVLIGADDPAAMLRHTEACRTAGLPFVADPSQQLPRMDRSDLRALVEGAAYLFTNEYEAALTEQRTGWSADDLLGRVDVRVTTMGSHGVLVESKGEPSLRVGIAREIQRVDPTGVGDAFRAGFLTGIAWKLEPRRAAQVGSLLATYVIETIGTQEYVIEGPRFLERLAAAYGDDAAADVEPHLRDLVPAAERR